MHRILQRWVIFVLIAVGTAACADDSPNESATPDCSSTTHYDAQQGQCVHQSLGDAGDDANSREDAGVQPGSDVRYDTSDRPDTGRQPDTNESLDTVSAPDAHSQPDADASRDTDSEVSGDEPDMGPQCGSPEVICGDVCVDTTTNPNHCGICNNLCPGGEVCAAGACQPNARIAGVLQAVNEARSTPSDCGTMGQFSAAGAVSGDANLHQAAQVHSEDMAENNFFSHTGSDGSSFSGRINAAGYVGQPIGENIAAGGTDPASVVQRWMDSDGHCRNIMMGSVTKIGVGFAENLQSQYRTYWTLNLAR